MARKKNTYEKQAKLSVILAVVGGAATLAAAAAILQAFDWENFWTAYNPRAKRILAIAAALIIGVVAGGAGLLLGWNSAEQRLNTQNKLSWTGFFLNAAVITLTLSCGVFFVLTRYAIEQKPGE